MFKSVYLIAIAVSVSGCLRLSNNVVIDQRSSVEFDAGSTGDVYSSVDLHMITEMDRRGAHDIHPLNDIDPHDASVEDVGLDMALEMDMALPPDPPSVEHISYGVFLINNYTPTYFYELIGDGQIDNAIINTSDPNGDYELRARNGNSPLSEAALFSRRAFTYHSEHVRDHCVQVNCRENRVATCNEPPGDGGVCPNPGLAGATCGCYDAAQNRCICWNYGEPRMLCDQMCTPVYEDVLDEPPASYMVNDGEWYSVMNP